MEGAASGAVASGPRWCSAPSSVRRWSGGRGGPPRPTRWPCGPDRAGLRRGRQRSWRWRRGWASSQHGRQVAQAVPGRRARRAARRAAAGRPTQISDAQVEEVIVRTLETTPKDATHWSTRRWPPRSGLSQTAVSRIWRAFGLQPHRAETWKLSTDPLFIDKVRDVVGLYLAPPERAVVLCVDEKSPDPGPRSHRADPAAAARHPERATHDYKRSRHLQPVRRARSDQRQGDRPLHARHRAIEFKQFLQLIDRAVPAELAVHVVLDNSSTHKTPAIQRWLLPTRASAALHADLSSG